MQISVCPVRLDSDNPARPVAQQIDHNGRTNHERPFGPSLFGKPAVEFGPADRKGVIVEFFEKALVAIGETDRSLLGKIGDAGLDDVAFNGAAPLCVIGYNPAEAPPVEYAPNIFFAPGYSPLSRTITLTPRSARTHAAEMPAGPAPTIAASNFSSMGFSRLRLFLPELGNQLGDYFLVIAHKARVGDPENGRIGVGVYGHDLTGPLDGHQVLDGPRDPYAYIEPWSDGPAGLSDLSFIGHKPGLHNRPRTGHNPSDQFGQLF